MPKVAIIGGGITGLSAAYYLERETDFEVVVIESGSALGGKIQTEQEGAYKVEAGPDSIFVGKPGATELISELGLGDKVIEPTASGFHLLVGSQLFPVPPGLASLAGVAPQVIDQAGFLSDEGKKRALAELSVPRGDGKDESISDFFTRRFGEEFSKLVAEPILAGTHGGDPSKLSMKALYPFYVDRELRDGNLSTPSPYKPTSNRPMFLSFKDGMKTMVDAIELSLKRTEIHLDTRIDRVEQINGKLKIVATGQASELVVDHVLLTTPAFVTADILRGFGEVTGLLSRIRFASSMIATAAYPTSAMSKELCGTGFLTPFQRDDDLTGCTWSSQKWPNRAPEDVLLVRFFFGGDGRPVRGSENVTLDKMRQTASQILGIRSEPSFVKIFDWSHGLPQYDLGHTKLVDGIEQSLAGSPFSVAGASYRGVGIPDCIRQGREAASKITEALG